MDSKTQLIKLIREKSYRTGEFTLASGKKSAFYIDLKATTLHPLGAKLIGALAVEALLKQPGADEIAGVGGLTLGADPIATAVSLAAHARGLHWPAFIVRKEPKTHGTSRYIEGTENLAPAAKLVIVEDVVTTGQSSRIAIERARSQGYDPRFVITVVDREEGGREALLREGVGVVSLIKRSEL